MSVLQTVIYMLDNDTQNWYNILKLNPRGVSLAAIGKKYKDFVKEEKYSSLRQRHFYTSA